ncbi:MAG TPA: hypothetical protein VHK67_01945 [Rhabdochlamydiaceae bacterium]|nr:hypothetical protein [Rhabdochlamydiaceae bacterium]
MDQKSLFYPVSFLTFQYANDHPHHFPLGDLNQICVDLLATADGYYSPKEQESMTIPYERTHLSIQEINASGLHYFSKPALGEILESAHQFFEKKNIHWAYLFIGSDQITHQGEDVRSSSDHELVIGVTIPVVSSVNTKASEQSYLKSDSYIQTQKTRIEEPFPLRLPDPSTGYPGAYIDPDALNNYLYSLNRHPGKRVDLEIGPTHTPSGVAFDFVITEERPYHLYISATNNVPEVIHAWQESFGFIHTQLSGRDDILKLNYSTDNFDSYYTAAMSYEAPLGLSPGKRWSIAGNYNRFLSAEFGLAPNLFKGTQGIVDGEIIGTIYQKKTFFLDAFGLLEYRHIHNRKHFMQPSVVKNFLFPAVGIKATRLQLESKIIASLQLESTISSLFWDVKKRLNALGRAKISPNWVFFQGQLYWSFYIEPLLQKVVKRMANEFVILAQIQNAFSYRLIPQLEGILGGVSTVRGYPQSNAAGDDLYLSSIEYRLHIPQTFKPRRTSRGKLFGKEFRWTPAQPKGRADWDLILRAFYDVGRTVNNRPVKGERNYTLAGIGWGADLVIWTNLVLKYDWGKALKSANGIHKGHQESYFSTVIMY